jgi:hypothetical protein
MPLRWTYGFTVYAGVFRCASGHLLGPVAVYCKQGEVKFTKRSAIFIIAGVVIVFAAWLYLRPAWQPPASIRASLLRLTPLGSSIGSVLSVAKNKGWVKRNGSVDYHPLSQYPCTLSGVLRHDPFPYRTSVWALWAFNRSNQLAEVSVSRYEE